MDWLFERYVGVVPKRAARRWNIHVIEQGPKHLDTGNRVPIKPDVVLYRQSDALLVLDAEHSDLCQVLAYCHALGLTQGALTHPLTERPLGGTIPIRGPGNILIHYLSLDLSGEPAQLEEQGYRLAEQVGELLKLQ